MTDIRNWLEDLGLGEYAEAFVAERILFDDLTSIDMADLKEIGLPIGPRKRVLNAIAALASDSVSGLGRVRDDAIASNGGHGPAERRHLTVMFCDLVGSTALSQQIDPEALRELMQAYQQACGQVIERYDGHVAQYLGDGLMTYFGWPRAHEDDAERAIRAALEIVEAVKGVPASGPLQVRIGIATGPVVVGQTGDGDASVPKLAVGETPNMAARLQGLAQADRIIISPDTRRLVGGTFQLADAGEHALKGIVEPVRAWRVTGLATARGRFDAAHGEALTPLVGRDLELGLLMERWTLAQEGEGQVVLLGGEPGIGKSRLLRALREKLQNDSANAMRFQCSPYYVNSPFWPIIHNFERALKFDRDESADSKLDKLESLIVQHYEFPLADVRFIAAMLSIPYEERYGELSMTPEKFKDETLRTLVDLTGAAATRRPTVLLFEDAHWADPSTLAVLDLLIDRVKAMPLLIVLTHRPEFENRWVDHGHVAGLNLSKLTRSQSAALISQVAGGKGLPEDLLEQILIKTDGVPLFVEELTQSILESGELIEHDDRYEYIGAGHQVTIPATLRDSLMSRLDRFTPVKEIAQIGAAIGREFSYELIAVVAPLPTTQLDDALAQLTESGLAFRRGTPPDAVYTFKHALVQDAAYDSLLKSRRQDLHGKIAKVIEARFPAVRETEPELLAHHLTQAGETAAAIPLWQKAGELAKERLALTEAVSHMSQGLALIEILPASAERNALELNLRVPLGWAWTGLKGWAAPEVWSSLHPALELAKMQERHDVQQFVLLGLWSHVNSQGRIAEAASWVAEMLQTAKSTSNDGVLILAHYAAASSDHYRGRFVESLAYCDQVLAVYDGDKHRQLADVGHHDVKTQAGIAAARDTWMLGYPDRAVKVFNDSIAHSRQLSLPFDLGVALTIGADLFDFRGEPEPYRQHAQECERLGHENSLPALWAILFPIRYGLALIGAGRAAEGIKSLKTGMEFWLASGGRTDVPRLKTRMAEGMAQLGDIDGALQLIDEAIEQVERPGWEERFYHAETLRVKGWLLTLNDDSSGAEESYMASLDCAREQQAKSWELRTSTSLAKLWQSQGKNEEAHELLAPVYNWFTEGFDTKDLKDAKALLDELADGTYPAPPNIPAP